MAAIVPVARPGAPLVTAIKSGLPVLATEHAGASRLLNWAQGRGQVAPCYSPGITIAAAANRSLFGRHKPRYQAIQRVHVFTLRSSSLTRNSVVAIKVPHSGSTLATVRVSGDRRAHNTFLVVEDRSSQSATEEQVSCNLAVTENDCVVESWGWWDMPRAQLALDANDNGVDLLTVAFRQRIYDGVNRSIGGEADAALAALTTCRRVLMEWAVPAETTTAISITGTSYAAALPGTTIVLARKLYRSSTTGTLSAKIYAKTADASDIADVRFTTTSGASAVINVPVNSNAAFAWFGAPLTFQVDCEDLDEADGLPGGTFDELTVEAKVTAGGDILHLASAAVWEA